MTSSASISAPYGGAQLANHAASQKPKAVTKRALKVRTWTESEFLNGKDEWQCLLQESSADSLFLSWDWVHQWYQLWGQEIVERLNIIAVYDGESLVGIAPLYIGRQPNSSRIFDILGTRILTFMGSRFREGGQIRAEYQEFIIHPEHENAVVELLCKSVFAKRHWDYLLLKDLIVGSPTHATITRHIRSHGAYSRVESEEPTYTVDCRESYETYCSNLGSNTRLKLHNRRSRLANYGDVELEFVAADEIASFVETLNQLHRKRWESDCFDPQRSLFFQQLVTTTSTANQSWCSLLKVNGQPLSAMANIEAGDRIYNIQLGFEEDFDKKISLGTLHLGYVIEACFSSDRITSFDLLAGEGKNSNYKSRLAQSDTTLICLQVVANPLGKLFYRFYDRFIRR